MYNDTHLRLLQRESIHPVIRRLVSYMRVQVARPPANIRASNLSSRRRGGPSRLLRVRQLYFRHL